MTTILSMINLRLPLWSYAGNDVMEVFTNDALDLKIDCLVMLRLYVCYI